jgi:hypothetical protein
MTAKKKTETAPPADPVEVDNHNRRSDDDALYGSFVDVVSGDHEGRRGAYEQTLSHDAKTGYPATILVRTRDAQNEGLVVNYGDVRTSEYTGGR